MPTNTFISIPVVIVGGGQAGLSASYYLVQKNIRHVVLERYRCAQQWRQNRWDSFCLVTPNWQCKLPSFPYHGDDPNGFMLKDEIVEYLEGFVKSFNPPLCEGVTVNDLRRRDDGKFIVRTSHDTYLTDQVIIASGEYDKPAIPDYAQQLNSHIMQIQAGDYKNPNQLQDGAVLVVGSGQSGVQIMEDLYLAGCEVHLAVGKAPRSPRQYRGRDVTDWLHEMGHYDVSIREHPQGEAVKEKTNHYLTGRDGGHEIDLRQFALKGVRLYGCLQNLSHMRATFLPDLEKNLDDADESYLGIRKVIDDYIRDNEIDAPEEAPFKAVWHPTQEVTELDLEKAGIQSVVWAIGFRPDYSWLNIDVFDDCGKPLHNRGVCDVGGIYFLGLSWLNTWGSGRFLHIAKDAEYLSHHIEQVYQKSTTDLCNAI